MNEGERRKAFGARVGERRRQRERERDAGGER